MQAAVCESASLTIHPLNTNCLSASSGLGSRNDLSLLHQILLMPNTDNINWLTVQEDLDSSGYAHIPSLLSHDECLQLTGLYDHDHLYRSTIDMQRYRFGQGEYKYFKYPLPPLVQSLREGLYPHLALIADKWMQNLGSEIRYPGKLDEFLDHCHSHGQARPTPLILRYEVGGYNTLHQDIYGDIYFPFQVVFLLRNPVTDFEGGELVFVEQLPRAQSRARVLSPALGDAVVFTTNFRPVKGSRGYYRTRMKHGVSPVTKGERYTMGIIFHDAT
jgi:hypothetical protein